MKKLIIGIIGSRRRNSENDYHLLFQAIHDLIGKYLLALATSNKRDISNTLKYKDITIVTGDCNKGGDFFARKRIPKDYKGIEVDTKHIRDPVTGEIMDFNRHSWFDYHTMCNIFYDRDREIAKESMDYLLALVAADRKGGTEKTIEYFKEYHKDWKKKLILL